MVFIGPAAFVVLWWLAFFVMLPMGVRNHDEAGVDTPAGAERAAPHAPELLKKALYAAALAAVVWAVGYALLATGAVDLRAV